MTFKILESMAKVITRNGKAKDWATQERKVFESLSRRPQTRLQVSVSTGVPLQNICRYIHNFRKSHTVYVVKTDRCPISGMRAEFISTDRRYAPQAQLRMFE